MKRTIISGCYTVNPHSEYFLCFIGLEPLGLAVYSLKRLIDGVAPPFPPPPSVFLTGWSPHCSSTVLPPLLICAFKCRRSNNRIRQSAVVPDVRLAERTAPWPPLWIQPASDGGRCSGRLTHRAKPLEECRREECDHPCGVRAPGVI